ncbi:hypothetical protein HK101_008871 [Irineochytrium annulatum]|nr:hypothetical protein HK101_008871 [Irineochytrium annulatum]
MNGGFAHTAANIAECEFDLMEELDYYMIVYHPYRPLVSFSNQLRLDKRLLQQAWFVVNDCYKADLPLLYPPHMIALAALLLTLGSDENPIPSSGDVDVKEWFSSLYVRMEDVGDILTSINSPASKLVVVVQQIFDLYQVMEEYKEAQIPEILQRLNKPLDVI